MATGPSSITLRIVRNRGGEGYFAKVGSAQYGRGPGRGGAAFGTPAAAEKAGDRIMRANGYEPAESWKKGGQSGEPFRRYNKVRTGSNLGKF